MKLTDEQYEIIEQASKLLPKEILKIDACAGSGKTYTLVEIAKHNMDKSFLYLAFNKAIVTEAKQKFPNNVKVLTTHSLAYRNIVIPKFANAEIKSDYKAFDLKELFPDKKYEELSFLLEEFRQYITSDKWDCHNSDLKIFMRAMYDGKLPLTHDFYLKLYQLSKHKNLEVYDYILLDEAQDTNDVTLDIFLDNDCRKILIGDKHQSIYFFRGAINALDKVVADYNMHLSYSFRSTQPILDKANYFLSRFAKDQDFIPMKCFSENDLKKEHTHCIITRTNATLISVINELSDKELALYKLIKDPESVFALSKNLYYFSTNKKKIQNNYKWLFNFKKYQDIIDYAEETDDKELLYSLDLVKEHGENIFSIEEKAQILYHRTESKFFLTNAHQSKGLEWDSIRLCDDFSDLKKDYANLCKSENRIQSGKRANTEAKKIAFIQEVNLYYVALTRARHKVLDLSDNNKTYDSYLIRADY